MGATPKGFSTMSLNMNRAVLISRLVAISVVQVGITATSAAAAEQPSSGKLEINVDRSKVDLERHRLEITMNRPASKVELKVLGEDKQLLAEETIDSNAPAGEPILVRWTQTGNERIARIELFCHDTEGNWKGIALIPWSVSVPHEEVHFDTDKADIQASEVPKLKDSLEKIQTAIRRYKDIGRIQLFIAGHTDTQGSASYNMDLSRRRAQAIAAWFVKSGLSIPVAFEGFGETALLVQTKDEVDEPRNRRVDYILSIEQPSFKKGRPQWRYLNKSGK
jgi:outer membrane protein OmpA-like peptidoglycan-associated protein